MKKLLLLAIIIICGNTLMAQNKFKTVKRSDVEVENSSKSAVEVIDNSALGKTISRQIYLSKPTDSQMYLNLIAKKRGVKVTTDENGMPSMIEGIPTNLKTSSTRNGRMNAVAAAAYNYLEAGHL